MKRDFEEGKYTVEDTDDGLMFRRHGEIWDAANKDFKHSKVIRAMFEECCEHDEIVQELVTALEGMFEAHDTFSNEFNPAGKIKAVCDWGLFNERLVHARDMINKHKKETTDG